MARGETTSQHDAARERAPARRASGPRSAGAALRPVESRQRKDQSLRLSGPVSAHFMIARDWRHIAVPMVAGFLVSMLAEWSFPPAPVLFAVIAALALVTATPWFVAFERKPDRPPVMRQAAVVLAIAVPMLLYGFALANFSLAHGSDRWTGTLAILAIVGMAGSIISNGRLSALLACQIGLCSGLAVALGSLAYGASVLVSCALVAYAVPRQMRTDKVIRKRHAEIAREHARAGNLLTEFELSGHGWFWETDRRGAITYLSPKIGEVIGRDVDAMIGRPFLELFILDAGDQEGERTLSFHLSARSSFQDLGVRADAVGGDERWWSISGRPVHDQFDNFVGFRGSGSDLTEKKRAQESETRLAHYDSLTSLANRFQMSQTLEKILNNLREDHRVCSVFLLDLDRFKQVNDTMGHPAGDALLTQVAQRLERTVDAAGRVGRLGGDEFQVILPGRIARSELAALADRIIENLSQPYSIEGHSVIIGVSIGIAVAPEDGVTSEALIRNADLALYAAKDGGRGRHHFYAADLHSDAEERRQLENDLRDALANGSLELYYQPVVHTTTEKIAGFEALLRWNHPTQGFLSPAKFIPVAEDAGLIAPIGEWALRTACMELANWPETVRVAVNVSPLQFANPALPSIVTNAIAAAQIDPSRLELEITESVFLNDDAGTDAMFAALKRVGVRLALDDFGTGYSSLGYLKKAPFDKIKIDQSFVRGATMKGSRNGAIIASIVSLAEALGMETTAEGVETLDELELVRMHGCSHIQGYIYEKPLNAAAAMTLLETGLIAVAQGPKSARETRQTMLRKVTLDHSGEKYQGTIRNVTTAGAMIEGLWNVPPGTVFIVELSPGYCIAATSRWCQADRMGVEFAAPLPLDANGRVSMTPQRVERRQGESIRLKRSG